MIALLLCLMGCGEKAPLAPPPAPDPAPAEVAPALAASPQVCATLTAMSVADPWSLPGTDEAGATDEVRTRVLDTHPDWATRCTVNRMGSMDVGPSCALSGTDQATATALYTLLEADFRACHGGWMLMDESDDITREVVADKEGAIRFVRIRDNGERGWEVSLGAMPLM